MTKATAICVCADVPTAWECYWCGDRYDVDTNWPYCSTLCAVHAEQDFLETVHLEVVEDRPHD